MINEKAVSKSQQRLFGMVHAIQKGSLDPEKTKDPEKLQKIAKTIKKKDAEKFARTKHKGLPNQKKKVKERELPTFKEFLVELTQKERKMLTPPASVQKVIKELMQERGVINRGVFYRTLADKFNLSLLGLKRIIEREPWVRGIPFEDLQKQRPSVTRRDPWAHINQKYASR